MAVVVAALVLALSVLDYWGEGTHYCPLPVSLPPLLLEKVAVSSLVRKRAEVGVSSWLSIGSQHSPEKVVALQCSSAQALQVRRAPLVVLLVR